MKMFLSGSECIAHGMRLSRVDVMAAYPITPNTASIQAIYDMIEDGEIDATAVNVESELGAMNVCAGAAAAGCRTFSCTAAQGLALMREALWMASGMALPVVLAITSRQVGSPQGLLSDFSDCLSERDASFLQFICEDGQEVVDSIVMAYKISEDERVLLPSLVVEEGYKLTHSFELVDVPEQGDVDRFLPKYNPKHAFINPDYPISQGAGAFAHYHGLKIQQYRAMQEAKGVIKEACREYAGLFGREYGLVEAYKTEDAEMIVVGMGTVVSLLRGKVDEYRQRGIRIGMLKIRVFRPFPEEEVRSYLSHAKKILVMDRACSPGNHGISYIEVRSALQRSQAVISNFIIGGLDISGKDVEDMVDVALERDEEFVEWHKPQFDQRAASLIGYDNYVKLKDGQKVERKLVKDGEDLLARGSTLCAGCVSLLSLQLCLKVFGKNTIVTNNAGCLMAGTMIYPVTAWKVPHIFFTYSHAGAAASGIEVGLKRKGLEMDILLYGGDGGIFDIGLQTLSAALERGHKITYVCYDNEAYMNTGVQRSGSTPRLASTRSTPGGKLERPKDIMKIVEAHGDVYAATASPAYPEDLMRKLKKAKESNKPSFIHILCPCPSGWDFNPSRGIEIARLSVETGVFVLYEYENGRTTVNMVPKVKKPVEEYLSKQGRFSHLTDAQIAEIQRDVDERFYELTGKK